MKTKLVGIWLIRHQRFEKENGQVLIFDTIKDTRKKIDELGKYHQDGGILRRVMPILLTPYDNKQIFEALKT